MKPKTNAADTSREFNFVERYNDEVFFVQKRGLWGVMNHQGICVPLHYSKISYLGSQVFVLTDTKGKKQLYDASRNYLLSQSFDELFDRPMKDATAVYYIGKTKNQSFLIDLSKLNILIGNVDSITILSSELVQVYRDRKNTAGEWIRRYQLKNFKNGLGIDSIEKRPLELGGGFRRITRKGESYNIDKNLQRVADYVELGPRSCYFTLIIPNAYMADDGVYVNIWDDSGTKPIKRAHIKGTAKSNPSPYENLAPSFGVYQSETGVVTWILESGNYRITIDNANFNGMEKNIDISDPYFVIQEGKKSITLNIRI